MPMGRFKEALLDKVREYVKHTQAELDDFLNNLPCDYDYADKSHILLEAMGEPIAFLPPACEADPKRKYLALSGTFLSGIWRKDFDQYTAMKEMSARRGAMNA